MPMKVTINKTLSETMGEIAICVYIILTVAIAASFSVSAGASEAEKEPNGPRVEENGTIHVPAFDLPVSAFLSVETRTALERQRKEFEQLVELCSFSTGADEDVVANRKCLVKHYYPAIIGKYRAHYKVTIKPETIAGVLTEIITPVEGISNSNRQRVLINLHGGSFKYGGRWGGQAESIPIAAIGKIKVVSVDYRMAPEHRFPAASEDVATVYEALLKDYPPENIGIYGCSAGGKLTAQVVAWLQKEGLPAPGAIGIFCAGAANNGRDGDSIHIGSALEGRNLVGRHEQKNSYLYGANLDSPLVYPSVSSEVMAKFPPSLLISSSRDFNSTAAIVTHAQLVRLGVEADLHVWEGLDHGFFINPDLPESLEVYEVIVKFFDMKLGKL